MGLLGRQFSVHRLYICSDTWLLYMMSGRLTYRIACTVKASYLNMYMWTLNFGPEWFFRPRCYPLESESIIVNGQSFLPKVYRLDGFYCIFMETKNCHFYAKLCLFHDQLGIIIVRCFALFDWCLQKVFWQTLCWFFFNTIFICLALAQYFMKLYREYSF